jgi:5-methylcytosine-specific restriction endonuclease McrA
MKTKKNKKTKRCFKCKRTLKTTNFYKNASTYGGISSECKECNLVRSIEYGKKHRDERLKYYRKRYRENSEKMKAQVKAGRLRDPEKHRVQAARWAKENPERARAIQRNATRAYRSRKFGAMGTFEWKEFDGLREGFNNTCLCCGRQEPDVKLEADHVIPLSIGGDNDIYNIQPLCRSCNAKKGNQHLDYRTREIALYEGVSNG